MSNTYTNIQHVLLFVLRLLHHVLYIYYTCEEFKVVKIALCLLLN